MVMARFLLHVAILFFVTHVSYGRPKELPKQDLRKSTKGARLADRLSYFDVELMEVMTRQQPSENVVLSPLSVKLLLGMLMEGAVGESSHEIRHALRLPRDPEAARKTAHSWVTPFQESSASVKLNVATHMFIADGYKINDKFAKTLQSHYSGEVTNLNVADSSAAAELINNWVKNATHNVIPSLVSADQITQDSYALLASAVYFKGSWRNAFETIGNKCFYKTPGQCTRAVFMQKNERLPYAYVNSIHADVVDVPYKDERFSMLVIIPRGRVQEIARDVMDEKLPRLVSMLRPTELDFTLPRFTAHYEEDLITPLQFLQIREVFGPNADLSGILAKGNKTVSISKIFHSAKVVVNEQGSEAAGATMAEFVPLIGQGIISVAADKPFLFFIRDTKSNVILFEGRVSDPEHAVIEKPAIASTMVQPVTQNTEVLANRLENNPAPLTIPSSSQKIPERPGRPKPLPMEPGRPNGFLPSKSTSTVINFQGQSKDIHYKFTRSPSSTTVSHYERSTESANLDNAMDHIEHHDHDQEHLGPTSPPSLLGDTYVMTPPPSLLSEEQTSNSSVQEEENVPQIIPHKDILSDSSHHFEIAHTSIKHTLRPTAATPVILFHSDVQVYEDDFFKVKQQRTSTRTIPFSNPKIRRSPYHETLIFT